MYINRDTPAIILDTHHIVHFKGYKNIVTVALHRFVNRVIDYFKNQMMQTVDAGGSNIHTGALSHRLQTFKNCDILRRIVGTHCSMI